MSVTVGSSDGDELRLKAPRPLFRLPLAGPRGAGIGTAAQYDVRPDGQHFLVNLEESPRTVSFRRMSGWQPASR